MSDIHAPKTFEPQITLSQLSRAHKISLIALISQFAPASTLYAANPPLKAAVDDLIVKGSECDTKEKDALAKQQAFFSAVTARGASETALDTALEVFKSNAKAFCKSEQDLKDLGVSRKLTQKEKGPPVPLVAPATVTAKPGKKLGSIDAYAVRIAGLTKYILAISPNPITPSSFEILPGTAAKRTSEGYVSGQQYWIRYCTERGQERSEWSAPVLVTAR